MLPEYPHKISWRSSQFRPYGQYMTFCWLNKKNEVCGPWTACRDHMQDGIHASINFKHEESTGSYYSRPYLMKLRLVFGISEQSANIDGIMDGIYQIEDQLKIPRTTFYKTLPPSYRYGAYVAIGSSRWLCSPVMVSFFLMLVRAGHAHTVGKSIFNTLDSISDGSLESSNWNDKNILQDGLRAIKLIMTHGDKKIFGRNFKKNYPSSVSIGTMHGCGIQGFGSGYTKAYWPQWHEVEK